jgi:serine/threonine protein kinase
VLKLHFSIVSNIQFSTFLTIFDLELEIVSKPVSSIEPTKKYQIPFEDIEIEKELGKGSYGRVCLGRWNDTPVALKFCKEKEKLDEFLKEATLMMYYSSHDTQSTQFHFKHSLIHSQSLSHSLLHKQQHKQNSLSVTFQNVEFSKCLM